MSASQVFRSILEKNPYDNDYRITFPDGITYQQGESPRFTIHYKTVRSVDACIRQGSLGFGESYMTEEIDVEGDFRETIRFGFHMMDAGIDANLMEKAKFALGYILRRNTIQGSRRNITHHYDIGNDFYELWLDREMQYTCAYFEKKDNSLEQAQLDKLDLVCRKLRLQPGETVVEAGCGWGGFARYAAQHYGVKVRAYNISKEQIEYARQKARECGISDQVEYVHDDYRRIGKDGQVYDKFASIGMFEHVGTENYPDLFDLIHKVTRPNGLALLHSIGKSAPDRMNPWVEKYIFPGSYIPSLSEMITPAEKKGRPLHVVDVENLRYHYALTLQNWADRFEKNADLFRNQYGEAFVRMFRLYLQGSVTSFKEGVVQLFQVLFENGYDNSAPLTRHHIVNKEKTLANNKA